MTDTAIQVERLAKVYEKRKQEPVHALKGISFSVRRGEIMGLLGPNGAGKSTTLKILTTLLAPTSGTAKIFGMDVVSSPLDVRKAICVVVQENAVELYLSVRNNFRTFGRFHGLSARETEVRAERVAELFGLRDSMNQKGIDLSGGMKRRVQVAKMFLVDKPLVFLDEATTGMDTFNKRTTIGAIKEEARKGRTILLTTHMLDEAEELCDSVTIINHGSIVATGTMETVKRMGLRLFTLTMVFRKVTPRAIAAIGKFRPTRIERKDGSVQVTVPDPETALRIVTSVRKIGRLDHFEITSADLEDVFVELLDRKEGS
ncbi:MAG: ABC transporter ATP-binding protein [Bacteroidota bacterium]